MLNKTPKGVLNALLKSCKNWNNRIFGMVYRPLSTSNSSNSSDILEKFSYICGKSQTPLLGLTIGQLLQKAADQYGDHEAVVFKHQNIRKNFHQVLCEADQVAAGFLSLGLKRGDRIGIWGPNSYEWVLTQWAAARAGLVLVNINPAYRSSEFQFALNKVEVKALIMAKKFRNQNLLHILEDSLFEPNSSSSNKQDESIISNTKIPSLKRIIVIDDNQPSAYLRWGDLLEMANSTLIKEINNLQRHIQFDEAANIQFTSGTTGNPKGATLSHHNIVNNAFFTGLRIGYNEKVHRICVPVPLYHCFGCGVGVLTGAAHGAACIFPSPVFSAKEAVKAIHQEKCTSLYGTPTMFVDILSLPDLKKYDVTSLSTGIMAGAPCPQELARGAIKDLNMKDFTIIYGMTECSPVTFQTMQSDSVETRCSTVGYPSDHVEVKIVDPVTNKIVPINTPGEVLTRGYNTMLGYWNDKDKTEEIITKDRWIRSGDIGVMNEDGYGKIVGRIKDMIIRGGENIYPREIEELLHTHPGILEAHVVGVPDSRTGEEVCAWVRCKPDCQPSPKELTAFCKERLSYFKVPRYFLFKDSFPLTVTGKVQKFVMRDITVQELGLGVDH